MSRTRMTTLAFLLLELSPFILGVGWGGGGRGWWGGEVGVMEEGHLFFFCKKPFLVLFIYLFLFLISLVNIFYSITLTRPIFLLHIVILIRSTSLRHFS